MLFSKSYSQTTFEKTFGQAGNIPRGIFLNVDSTIQTISITLEITKLTQYGIATQLNHTGIFLSPVFFDFTRASDSGFIATGYATLSNPYRSYPVLSKTNSQGIAQWAKYLNIGYASSRLHSSCISPASENIFSVGNFGDTSVNTSESYLQICDSAGNFVRANAISFSHPSSLWDIKLTSDNEMVAGGYISPGGTCFIKFDTSGNVIWAKSLNDSGSCTKLIPTSDGGFIAIGVCSGIPNTQQNTYVCKTNSLGNLLWYKKYLYHGTFSPCKIQEKSDGSFIVAGSMYNSTLNSFGFLLWLDAYGNEIRFKKYNYFPNPYYTFLDMIESTTHDIFVLGHGNLIGSDGNFIMKTDSLGDGVCDITTNNILVNPMPLQYHSESYQITPLNFTSSSASFISSTGIYTSADICSTSLVAANQFNEPLVFPNPTVGEITIQFSRLLNFKENSQEIKIYNSFGQLVWQEPSVSFNSNKEITLSLDIPNGIYFGQISSSNGTLPFRFSIAK